MSLTQGYPFSISLGTEEGSGIEVCGTKIH